MRFPKTVTRVSLLLVLTTLTFGCATVKLESSFAPNVEKTTLQSFHVVRQPNDERGIEELIKSELMAMGFSASSSDDMSPPNPVDAVITYVDRWMWDITMYMIDLNIQLRDPATGFVMGSGFSHRTSMARKPPEEMVKEVLHEIFSEK